MLNILHHKRKTVTTLMISTGLWFLAYFTLPIVAQAQVVKLCPDYPKIGVGEQVTMTLYYFPTLSTKPASCNAMPNVITEDVSAVAQGWGTSASIIATANGRVVTGVATNVPVIGGVGTSAYVFAYHQVGGTELRDNTVVYVVDRDSNTPPPDPQPYLAVDKANCSIPIGQNFCVPNSPRAYIAEGQNLTRDYDLINQSTGVATKAFLRSNNYLYEPTPNQLATSPFVLRHGANDFAISGAGAMGSVRVTASCAPGGEWLPQAGRCEAQPAPSFVFSVKGMCSSDPNSLFWVRAQLDKKVYRPGEQIKIETGDISYSGTGTCGEDKAFNLSASVGGSGRFEVVYRMSDLYTRQLVDLSGVVLGVVPASGPTASVILVGIPESHANAQGLPAMSNAGQIVIDSVSQSAQYPVEGGGSNPGSNTTIEQLLKMIEELTLQVLELQRQILAMSGSPQPGVPGSSPAPAPGSPSSPIPGQPANCQPGQHPSQAIATTEQAICKLRAEILAGKAGSRTQELNQFVSRVNSELIIAKNEHANGRQETADNIANNLTDAVNRELATLGGAPVAPAPSPAPVAGYNGSKQTMFVNGACQYDEMSIYTVQLQLNKTTYAPGEKILAQGTISYSGSCGADEWIALDVNMNSSRWREDIYRWEKIGEGLVRFQDLELDVAPDRSGTLNVRGRGSARFYNQVRFNINVGTSNSGGGGGSGGGSGQIQLN